MKSNKLKDSKFRMGIGLVFILTVILISYGLYSTDKIKVENEIITNQVKKSLEDTFKILWEDAKDIGIDDIDLTSLKALHRQYNESNKNNNVYLTSIDKSISNQPPVATKKYKNYSIDLDISGHSVKSTVMVNLPNRMSIYILYTLVILIVGLLLMIFYPAYRPLDQYYLAKIYGMVFDRKVSSKKPWGAWQLTHVGTGSGLANIKPNDYDKANDNDAINTCLDGVYKAIECTNAALESDVRNTDNWGAVYIDLLSIHENIKKSMMSRPFLNSEADVKGFISYIRKEALKSVMITVSKPDNYEEVLGVMPTNVETCPPSGWLTDGYNIFMPESNWFSILKNIRDGIHMAYDKKVSNVRVYTDENSPFIYIDFIVNDCSLDEYNLSRLKEYMKRPYPGDLDDLIKKVNGFGKLLILDASHIVDFNDRKISKKSKVKTFTLRLMMRRIDKDERDAIVDKVDEVYKKTEIKDVVNAV